MKIYLLGDRVRGDGEREGMIGNDWRRLFWIGEKKARKGDGAIGEG